MKTEPFLSGTLVFLRPVEKDDLPLLARWLNDPVVTHTMFYGQRPMNAEQVDEMILSQVRSPNNTVFMACDKKTRKPIGFAGLYDLFLSAQKASFRILIGETSYWGKGYGTEITKLVTFYGFDRLNLHRIALGVTADNAGAVRAYTKAGYVQEGVLRDDLFRNGRWYDSILMAILRKEFDRNDAYNVFRKRPGLKRTRPQRRGS